MPGGRPRKPRAQHALEGTLRPDRHGAAPEPSCPSGVPQPPPELQGEALAFWHQIVPGLVARGVAGEEHGPALTVLCEAWARYRRFSREMDDEGTPTGRLIGLNTIVGTAIDKLRGWLADFGLTPASREKVRAAPQPGGPKTPVAARKR